MAEAEFGFTGSPQPFVVPGGVTEVTFRMSGGDTEIPGRTDFETRLLTASPVPVTPGETLYVFVGGPPDLATGAGGWNGGGDGIAFSDTGGVLNTGGGGATDIRRGGTAESDRFLVAGGRGGLGMTETAGFALMTADYLTDPFITTTMPGPGDVPRAPVTSYPSAGSVIVDGIGGGEATGGTTVTWGESHTGAGGGGYGAGASGSVFDGAPAGIPLAGEWGAFYSLAPAAISAEFGTFPPGTVIIGWEATSRGWSVGHIAW